MALQTCNCCCCCLDMNCIDAAHMFQVKPSMPRYLAKHEIGFALVAAPVCGGPTSQHSGCISRAAGQNVRLSRPYQRRMTPVVSPGPTSKCRCGGHYLMYLSLPAALVQQPLLLPLFLCLLLHLFSTSAVILCQHHHQANLQPIPPAHHYACRARCSRAARALQLLPTVNTKPSLAILEASCKALSSVKSPMNALPVFPSDPRVMYTSARCTLFRWKGVSVKLAETQGSLPHGGGFRTRAIPMTFARVWGWDSTHLWNSNEQQ
jgi:hypothetical protein